MLTISAGTTTEPPSSSSNLDSLTRIDISNLSQSDLHSLSVRSRPSFDLLHGHDDFVVPNIDRSVFNESACSRRQTYPRSRLRPRSRLPDLLPSSKSPPSDDPENKFIIYFLKQLIDPNSPPPPASLRPLLSQSDAPGLPLEIRSPAGEEGAVVARSVERKRKRGRKSKVTKLQENGVGVRRETVNRKGVAVHAASLEGADDIFDSELKNRTLGLKTEEESLGFLTCLEGQWCSRRKKRKIVDATHFCDLLPVGWKLLLGLKRREGRVSVYCRRYISPTGEQFMSCKEVAAFLRSYLGRNDVNWPMDDSQGSIQPDESLKCTHHVGFSESIFDKSSDMKASLNVANAPASDECTREVSLPGIDNLAEIQVWDLFECCKCNTNFERKDEYLMHLSSFHQKNTRRYKLGMSVGEGVIIRDGKYECQFCHKIFLEKRSYNGHVGIHVRNHVRGSEDLTATPNDQKSIASPNEFPSGISKMDALIEIAQNSILDNLGEVHKDEINDDSVVAGLNVEGAPIPGTYLESKLGSDPSDVETGSCMADKNANQQATDVKANVVCKNISKHKESSTPKIGFHDCPVKLITDENIDIQLQTVKDNVVQNDTARSSMPLMQSINSVPAVAIASKENRGEGQLIDVACWTWKRKGRTAWKRKSQAEEKDIDYVRAKKREEEKESGMVDQKVDNEPSLEDLRLDEIEPLKYDFVNGEESSLHGISMQYMTDERFGSGTIISDMNGRHQGTTLCIWCRTDISTKAIDIDFQSESIGFMCSSCKDKISRHLDSSQPVHSKCF